MAFWKKQKEMTSGDIERYLQQVGKALEQIGIQRTVRLLMLGGGFMINKVGNRKSTEDIDVIIPLENKDPTYSALKKAIRDVGYANKLSPVWINDIVETYVQQLQSPTWQPWKRFGPLEVFIPPMAYIFCTKLLAGRDKDIADMRAMLPRLGISTEEQALQIFNGYALDAYLGFSVRGTLERLFRG